MWTDAAIVVTLLAVVALLVAEWRDRLPGIWIAKPVASLGFVATALSLGVDTNFDRLVFAGLVACVAGDVLLIVRDRQGAFLAGVGAFAVGHLLYAGAFVLLGVHPLTLVVTGVLLGAVSYVVWRWLAPHVPAPMVGPVIGYIAIITAMASTAYSATVTGADLRIAVGATLFFLSDLSVARDSFVKRAFVNRAWGLPTYYAAQILLALSVGS